MNALDPIMVDHALRLAEEEWHANKPTVAPVQIVPSGERAWFVVQTAVRGEKKARELLGDAGYETWLPIMRKDIFQRRKKLLVTREYLLFNRYLFAELPCSTRQWGELLADDAIDCVLGMGGRPSPLPEASMRRFMAAEAAGDFDDTVEAKIRRGEIVDRSHASMVLRFPVGSRVRATRGPFGGFSGMVVSVTGRGTVKAMVALFGGLTPVEFAAEVVAPA